MYSTHTVLIKTVSPCCMQLLVACGRWSDSSIPHTHGHHSGINLYRSNVLCTVSEHAVLFWTSISWCTTTQVKNLFDTHYTLANSVLPRIRRSARWSRFSLSLYEVQCPSISTLLWRPTMFCILLTHSWL